MLLFLTKNRIRVYKNKVRILAISQTVVILTFNVFFQNQFAVTFHGDGYAEESKQH
jgi:hypothetical protein